ncbi:MAG: 4-alpha-glucanotransferase [Thermoanaerobaculaceae bacterium]|nr:4-alpha-glucanotransferase [Thermoanaerobaculaceae bacterium]MDI9623067.1 4-alpha-glucanotransferase [Acidobacteriota bacterium]NLH10552.1 4-alpha-glucanotransferase [Holophagae bacterium]HPW55382.1 4-alpha-glucanotransferase [Thermoanaerobaculaceae bacterium]
MRLERACGVLLHPTCLNGPFGIGDIGPAAHRYLDWLAEAGVRWWQVLPLNPTGPWQSPYNALSSFGGNPLLISPELLVRDGVLAPSELDALRGLPEVFVDFEALVPAKLGLLHRAFSRFLEQPPHGMTPALATFRHEHRDWLEDLALFLALRDAHGGVAWHQWPTDLALRRPHALASWGAQHRRDVEFHVFCQFLFDQQWRELREHARSRGVLLLGDIPIFVADDSADVWAHRELFLLDAQGQPTVVAGVPPDYFSETGQLWGNPLYDWAALERTGFFWWIERFRSALRLVDAARLDHFRGFVAYWEVPADAPTASGGRWVAGPGRALFDAVRVALGDLPLVAEDLGFITEDVTTLRRELGLPGMAVLQFAFDPAQPSSFLPYRHERNLVVYTGTHDNNTTLGWYLQDASEAEKDFVRRYLGTDAQEIHWDMIRAALASVAALAIVPHQDLAGLGADCRMNTPGLAAGNWRFRITDWMLSDWHQQRLADLIVLYGR